MPSWCSISNARSPRKSNVSGSRASCLIRDQCTCRVSVSRRRGLLSEGFAVLVWVGRSVSKMRGREATKEFAVACEYGPINVLLSLASQQL